MKKIFFVTGEVSGDRLAAWYLQKLRQQHKDLEVHVIGGPCLHAAGAKQYDSYDKLNLVGIVEIIKHIPFIVRFMRTLINHILLHNFDTVVVVDFPGFNLRLIRLLKLKKPSIKIVYVSPPQLWCWGAWRVKKLKKYCDQVVVIYPFEVAWYAQRGMTVVWLGTPVAEQLAPYRELAQHKKPVIALIPGSRSSEIKTLLPIFLQTAVLVKQKHPSVRFVMPRASSIQLDTLNAVVKQHGHEAIWQSVTLLSNEQEKYETLAHCCAALCKPGTVTLELALLRVPAVVAFKTSWLTYWLAWSLVKVPFMALPNLLSGKELFKEYIQGPCKPVVLAHALELLYVNFLFGDKVYQQRLKNLDDLANSVQTR